RATITNGSSRKSRTHTEFVLLLQWPYASCVESSSGLALLRCDPHRSGSDASPRQVGFVLFGGREDRRSTFSARGCGSAYRWALAAHVFRGVRRHFARPWLLRIQFCALNAMGGILVQ